MTSGIIEILKENNVVATLVGTDDKSEVKVYPFIAPQKVVQPYILVSEVSLNPTSSKGCPETLDYPNYEINCYGLSFHKMELLQMACRSAVEGSTFTTDAGASFGYIRMINRRDLFLPQDGGQAGGLYVKSGTYEAEVSGEVT